MKLSGILLSVVIFSTFSIACVDNPSCKADFKSCKKNIKDKANQVWKCAHLATNKFELEKCDEFLKKSSSSFDKNSTCN
jgi:hypothetical protein